MKNFSKILCVVLALVMALSVASCSLSKQYAYQKDDIELPIGVYVYYMYSSYNEAQTLAQKSDLYDAATGKYDGKKSFLKIEITDEDGNTAIAEDWITNKTKEKLQNAVAIETKFKDLGCTVDQAELDQAKTYIQQAYWDQSLKAVLEPCGVSFDSFFMAEYTINIAEKNAAFKAEYSEGGPSAVSTPDLTDYFTKNYTSYKYFSANLYTTEDNGERIPTQRLTPPPTTPPSPRKRSRSIPRHLKAMRPISPTAAPSRTLPRNTWKISMSPRIPLPLTLRSSTKTPPTSSSKPSRK